MALSKTTQDHDEIRQWAEARGAVPAEVTSTAGEQGTGILRLMFRGAPHANDSALEEISWDEFFERFDSNDLALVYQDETSEGAESNFNKLIHPDDEEHPRRQTRSHTAGSSAEKKAASKSSPKKSSATKSSAKKSSPAKSSVKKASTKKTAGKSSAKKAPAKKSAAKKTASKSSAKKSSAKKAVKKAPAKRTAAKKTAAAKSSAKKSAGKKAASKKSAAGKRAGGRSARKR